LGDEPVKKTFSLIAVFLFVISCGPKSDVLERFIENGVEVVVSGIESYQLEGEPGSFVLEEEIIIDLEDDQISNVGLYKMDSFGVDFDGNIYIVNQEEKENHIFKFTRDGQFEMSFGRHGQGPGELMRSPLLTVTGKDEIYVSDIMNSKIVQYRQDGSLVREIPTVANIMAYPLKNGNFMVMGRLRPDMTAKVLIYPLEICDRDFNMLTLLEEFKLENARLTQRLRGTPLGFGFSITDNRIYTGNEERDYEIWEFDLEGNLVRKIRKDYKPVVISEEFKQKRLESQNAQVREIIYFDEVFPPFQTLFTDEAGYLFAVTFEKGKNDGESMIDIFNPDGAFIGRMSAGILVNDNAPISAIVRGGRLHYIQEKANGYKRFIVEKIIR
jgi:hypothetical protein